MKPKDWLLANGHIKEITRGRISRENHTRLADAVKNGAVIDGYTPVEVVNKSGETVTKNADATAPVGKVIAEGFIRMQEDSFQAHRFVDGKRKDVSMRTICATCTYSFIGHICDEPKVWVDHSTKADVYFEKRTTPLTRRF